MESDVTDIRLFYDVNVQRVRLRIKSILHGLKGSIDAKVFRITKVTTLIYVDFFKGTRTI